MSNSLLISSYIYMSHFYLQTDYQVDYSHDHDLSVDRRETQENNEINKWIKRGLHLILQIAIVGYFAYATYHYHDMSKLKTFI